MTQTDLATNVSMSELLIDRAVEEGAEIVGTICKAAVDRAEQLI